MGRIASDHADHVVITSDNPRFEDPEAIIEHIRAGIGDSTSPRIIVSRREAIEYAIRSSRANDVVLIAGKGHETYQEIRGVRHDFDDSVYALESVNMKRAEESD